MNQENLTNLIKEIVETSKGLIDTCQACEMIKKHLGILVENKPKPVITITKKKTISYYSYFIKRCKKYNYKVFKYEPMMFTTVPAALFINENTKHINIKNIRNKFKNIDVTIDFHKNKIIVFPQKTSSQLFEYDDIYDGNNETDHIIQTSYYTYKNKVYLINTETNCVYDESSGCYLGKKEDIFKN